MSFLEDDDENGGGIRAVPGRKFGLFGFVKGIDDDEDVDAEEGTLLLFLDEGVFDADDELLLLLMPLALFAEVEEDDVVGGGGARLK